MSKEKTKIICTLGPSTDNNMKKLIKAGLSVARMNMSHGTHDEHATRINQVKECREELNLPTAIMLDTKGPEIRIKTFKNGFVELKDGDSFIFDFKDVEGDEKRIGITYPDLHKYLKNDDKILADDGYIEFSVTSVSKNEIVTKVINGGKLSNRKSLNFPDVEIDMEYLSEIDKKDIAFGVEQGVDFIALSFVRNAEDVNTIREYLKEINGSDIYLISKIENRQGVNNIDDIIKVSDGIMVARGDMGVEIPFEELPGIQKKLIISAIRAGKIVVTATQMLESMVTHSRPTRAEISDVANAVYDRTSATMLSGETAAGKYPVETVKTMAKIINQAEKGVAYKRIFQNLKVEIESISDAITHSAIDAAHNLNAKAIVVVPNHDESIRRISFYRPEAPIIVMTNSARNYYKLSMCWGVTPVLVPKTKNSDELSKQITESVLSTGIVKKGDLVVILAGEKDGEVFNSVKMLYL